MYIYIVGYGTMEESDYIYLTHADKWCKETFEDVIIEASKIALSKKADEDYFLINMDYKENKLKAHVTFEDILFDVVDILIKEHGFEKLKVTGNVSTFGWANLLENDWKEDTKDDTFLVKLRAVCQKDPILKEKIDKLIVKESKRRIKEEGNV